MGRINYYNEQGNYVSYPQTFKQTKNPHREFMLGFEYEIDTYNAGLAAACQDEDAELDADGEHEPFDPKKVPSKYCWQWEGLGSVSGWEVKSHIAPLRYHKLGIRRFLSAGEFNTNPDGPETNDGGIHVSITANDEVKRLEPKVSAFLNDVAYRPFFLKLSKRQRGRFDLYSPQRGPGARSYKYCILNLGKKRGQVYEFRLFAAHPELLQPALEALDSLFTMARDTDETMTPQSWTAYCNSKPKYRSIAKLLNECLQICYPAPVNQNNATAA